MRRLWLPLLVSLLVGCGLLAGPGVPVGTVVDGWRIGTLVDCSENTECEAFLPAATTAFHQRDPGHPPIVHVALHHQGQPGQVDGHAILMTCSGGCSVVAVFRLVDGSIHAIGVGTPGISTEPMTFDYGSETP